MEKITKKELNQRVKEIKEHCSKVDEKIIYKDFNSDNFILLNQYTHKMLHFVAQQCHKLGKEKFFKNLEYYVDLMEKLNKDVKSFPMAR